MKRGFLMGAAAAACMIAAPAFGATVKTWPVAVRTLDAPVPAGYHVYRSANEWRNRTLRPDQAGGVTLPDALWQNEMVISAAMGRKPTAGYSVKITSVARVGTEIVVTVRETAPAPDAIVAQVLTDPSHTVAVKRMVGPVVFVVNGKRTAEGTVPAETPPAVDRPDAGAPSNLAKSIFILHERGGIAGLNRQTIAHLYGRPILPGEVIANTRETRNARVAGPVLRIVEQAIRDSGFMDLDARYAADRPVADGMTRTIRVQLGGVMKTVTVEDGAIAPKGFNEAWEAIQTAVNSRGTIVTPWAANN